MKVCGALYILTYEYNYKVITWCDTILQEYYITERHKCENTKRYIIMNSTKMLTSYKRKTRKTSRGPGRIGLGRSSADPKLYRCATLITRKSTAVQVPRSEHAGPRESELPNEWCGEYQVVCIDKHTYIDKSESKSMYWKSCHERRHTGAGNETSREVNMAKLVIQLQSIDLWD